MASLFAGGALAANLYKYNRKNFMFDRKMKQEREFQEQDMRVEQFGLYREDVRDLVELTVAKMDLYLIAAALLIDKTMMLIAKQNEAFPASSPGWATALNALSVASGVFYLALSLWLAMYASISAQSFGVRLLTQFVRLPYASAEQIEMASAQVMQYESGSVDEMIRLPILQANVPGAREGEAPPPLPAQAQVGGAAGVGPGAGETSPAPGLGLPPRQTGVPAGIGQSDLLPVSAMLDHIRLYRRVQLNWQAYDAYARVSLFVGANSLLYSCLYWALGQFLQNAHADAPAIGIALIFSCLQLVLCRLDLRLRRREVLFIGILLFTTPILTTVGMVLFMDISRGIEPGDPLPRGWKRSLMEVCAVCTNLLHTLVVALTLKGAWPDRVDAATEALLPGKFRSTLYLDVFGWLLNPGGPGTGEAEENVDERAEQSASGAAWSWQPATALPRVRCWTRVCCCWRRVRAPAATPLQSAEGAGGEPVRHRPDQPAASGIRQEAASVQQGDVTGVGSPALPRGATLPARQLDAERTAARGNAAATWPLVERGRDRVATPPQVGLLSRSSRSPSPSGGSFASSARHSALEIPPDRGVDLDMDVRVEAFNLFHPDGSPAAVHSGRSPAGPQELQYGGRESLPMATIQQGTAPGAEATFVQSSRSGRARQRKTHPPGTTPWRAFCQGTVVILFTWSLNTVWALSHLVSPKGWTSHKHLAKPGNHGNQSEQLGDKLLHFSNEEPAAAFWRDACLAAAGPLLLHQAHAGLAIVTAGTGAVEQVRDAGCGLRRSFLDTGLACPPGQNASLRLDGCIAYWLQRGGRTLRLCRFRRFSTGLRLTQGRIVRSPHRLEQLALGWPSSPGSAATRATRWGDLQVVGRMRSGELLAMRLGAAHREACLECPRRLFLLPEFEVTLRHGDPAEKQEERERLLLLRSSLVSLSAGVGTAAATGTCAGESVDLRAWHLASSASALVHVPGRSGQPRDLARVVGRLCQVDE